MNYMRKFAFVILTSLFLITSATAFTQGHPTSQLFNSNGNPFSGCAEGAVLTSQGECVDPSTSSGGSGSYPGDVFVNESGDTMSGNLEMSGNNIVDVENIGGTSGECGINQDCPDTIRAENIMANTQLCLDRPYSEDNDHQITSDECISAKKLSELSTSGGGSGDGYIGNSKSGYDHLAKENIDMEGNQELENADEVESAEFCFSSGGDCISSWSDVESYISTSSNYIGNSGSHTAGGHLDMGSNDVLNVKEIKSGTDTSTYSGGFGIDFASSGIQMYDDSGIVRLIVDETGAMVGGGLTVNDNLDMVGNDIEDVGSCSSCDLAETVEKKDNSNIEKGDVVSINENGELTKASEKYDTAVAGVVSSTPVIMMGAEHGGIDFGDNVADGEKAVIETEEGKKEVPLALAGLVPVKASVANGEIEPGDKLATSKISGHAVKAKPAMETNGRKIYGSGIIGKAMEPLEDGKGKIKMLVNLE